MVDTRVLGRPDKADGSEKARPNWSFVMKAYAGAIDQALSARMTTAECSTDAMSNDAMTGERKGKECALVFLPDHVVHGKSSGSHCKCTTRLGHGGVANALSSLLSKKQCETCCNGARSVGVSFGNKR